LRKGMLMLLSAVLIIGLWACSTAEELPEEKPKEEVPVTVVTPGGNTNIHKEEPLEPEKKPTSTAEAKGAAVLLFRIKAAYDMQAAFLSQQGGIVLADLQTAGYTYLSGDSASELYFDGNQVCYTTDEGIYALSMEGETVKLSDHMSYALWVEGEKIYFIRQTNLNSELPLGELWCMEADGSGAVVILPTQIKGDFCIKGGWIYYVSADDGALYRSMLFGSQAVKLADGPLEICFVTERGVYYRELGGRQTVRRIDLRTNANISLGAYGEIVAMGDSIAFMARREGANGSLDNRFTLMSFDDRTQEMSELLVFENVGADSLAWVQEGYVYLYGADGGVYRMALEDGTQTKEALFAGDTVFAGGRAWHVGSNVLEVYDCTTLETTAIQLG